MNELMNITEQTPIEIALGVDADGMTTAKQLYNFLELNPSHYKRWCTRNITNNPYAEEDVDYFVGNISPAGRGSVDYKITVDFAKQIATSTRSKKGLAARNYFIACENIVKDNIVALKEENQKLKLLTVSNSQKFAAMYPQIRAIDKITEHIHERTIQTHI